MGPVSDDTKLWLCGFVFILISIVFFYVPWEFIRIYEYIKDNEQAMKFYNRLRKVYGFMALTLGIIILGRMMLKIFI